MTTLGLDFGTTNSVASFLRDGTPTPIVYGGGDLAEHLTFPTSLAFWEDTLVGHRIETMVEGGQWAIDAYVAYAPDCRLIQSFKSFAGTASFSDTRIYGRRYDFDDLMSAFIAAMSRHSDEEEAWKSSTIVIGRPVRFAGASPNDALAMKRYHAALKSRGFDNIIAVYEPLAAAYYYVRRLAGSATVFVADLGGGTSDFSIVRFTRQGSSVSFEPLASLGTDVAGDRFDYRIIDNVLCPELGKGSQYRGMGKTLDIPDAYYAHFTRWNRLSFMRYTKEFRELKRLANRSLSPEKIDRFIAFLESEQSYAMYRAVAQLKRDLSEGKTANFELSFSEETLRRSVSRNEFETWIESDLGKLSTLADDTLAKAQMTADSVDAVFLTGGSSFVPAVRNMFESRFGSAKIATGDQFVSIANGLALIGDNQAEHEWAAIPLQD